MEKIYNCYRIHSTMTDMNVYIFKFGRDLTDAEIGEITMTFTHALNKSEYDEKALAEFWWWVGDAFGNGNVCDEDFVCTEYETDGIKLVGIEDHGLFKIVANYSERW